MKSNCAIGSLGDSMESLESEANNVVAGLTKALKELGKTIREQSQMVSEQSGKITEQRRNISKLERKMLIPEYDIRHVKNMISNKKDEL